MTSSMLTHSFNRIFDKIGTNVPTYIQKKNVNMLKELFDTKLSEGVKCFIEAALRVYVLKNVCTGGKADLEQVKIIVEISIEGARRDKCLPTLPVLILSDTFDCTTIQQCEDLFEYVESNVAIWKEVLFFAHCKNQVLRMCNDVLRRLSRSQNTIFCGRILLFLARFFPFSERSGLNLISEFNLENVTVFTDTEVLEEMETEEDSNDADKKPRPSLDYTLYTKFWALQDFFRNPAQCFQKSPWKLFTKYSDDILEAFLSFKLDNVQAVKTGDSAPPKVTQISVDKQADQYFPKYLTSQKLLDLQFSDSNFRRYILIQMLILSQYLTSTIKFKQETLSESQFNWVRRAQDRCISLLAETPTNGRKFVEITKSILKREEIWSEWKNSGCPEIKKPGSSLKRKMDESVENNKDEDSFQPLKKREKRKLGDIIKEGESKNKYVMSNAEMTRLWNICRSNIEACQSPSRDFVPSLETYFSPAVEQVQKANSKDDLTLVNDSNFGWRGLRLLASKSPHFFTNSGNSIATLPEYLTNMIKKVAKELPSQVTEGVKEEEDDDIAVLEQNEVKEDVEVVEEEEEENAREESKPLSEEDRKLLSKAFAENEEDAWKKLGKKLGFEADELDYFKEGKSLEECAKTMLDRWVENDEDANKENLIYYLEGLKLNSILEKVYN